MNTRQISRLLRRKMIKTPEVLQMEEARRERYCDQYCSEEPWAQECRVYEV